MDLIHNTGSPLVDFSNYFSLCATNWQHRI